MLNYNYEDIRSDVARIYLLQQKVRKVYEKAMDAQEMRLANNCEKRLKLFVNKLYEYSEVLVKLGEMGLAPSYIHDMFQGPGNLFGNTLDDLEQQYMINEVKRVLKVED